MNDEERNDEKDVLALSGLRRLVLHARDQLTKTTYTPRWDYNSQAWQPWQVEAHTAHVLARHVLTLVADCIPAGDAITSDEAQEIKANHAQEAERLGKQIAALEAQTKELIAERDAAVDSQAESEAVEAETWDRLERAKELARTDAAAAIKELLGDEAPEPATQPVPDDAENAASTAPEPAI